MEYILKTVNHKGELIKESKLELTPHNILIQKVNLLVNMEQMQKFHEYLTESLQRDSKVITMREGIELQILEIKE